ncbi:hypothetical protein GGI01_002269 [Coemansia sp. RSA 376]|nr:hypothetical protein GGI14_001328 [Coemansia sp. S680]KAJ2029530.1 hypothetical protein H4S03_007369 [Coemansia sp. S3946]KAJ2044980.1 hypothetical protein GGI08_006947 [Coemansia sp. S2]KAJ2114185.1 hypothetical protein IW146_003282 [Coemansia sp. RSA 922]KAJ2261459.1 hypothetical protein GGI01_002269 [Coemansia sp. RSA 376]KAJ2340354.1 hypothetical protein GGH92_006298 [Coemansia sp. RSA 2673]KAJ2458444.1 hypothetical protein GGI03_005822 [Coemansia sp. RSA 2337]
MNDSELKQRRLQAGSVGNTDPEIATTRAARPSARSNRNSNRLAWWAIVARIAITMLGLSICMSYLITETAFWGHSSKWTNWRNYIPRQKRVFTQLELAKHDGSNPSLPLLLAIEGDVYDVSSGWGFYGPGSSYHLFAGHDASRAFGTNCLSRKDHVTHDTRGLSEKELAGIKGWHRYFDNHQKYVKLGVVQLTPIDPEAPIPPPCEDAKPRPK